MEDRNIMTGTSLETGRWRRFERMKNKADTVSDSGRIAVCDFVCPYKEGREKVWC